MQREGYAICLEWAKRTTAGERGEGEQGVGAVDISCHQTDEGRSDGSRR